MFQDGKKRTKLEEYGETGCLKSLRVFEKCKGKFGNRGFQPPPNTQFPTSPQFVSNVLNIDIDTIHILHIFSWFGLDLVNVEL